MADVSYVVDVLLKAQDAAGTAFAKVAAELGLLEAAQERQKRQAESTGAAYSKLTGKIAASGDTLVKQRRGLNAITQEEIVAQQNLDKASRDYVKTLAQTAQSERDVNKVRRDQVAAFGQMIAAEQALQVQINKSNEARRERDKINATSLSNEIKLTAILPQQEEERLKNAVTRAETEAKIRVEKEREANELISVLERQHETERSASLARLDRLERENSEKRRQYARDAMAEENALSQIREATAGLEAQRASVEQERIERLANAEAQRQVHLQQDDRDRLNREREYQRALEDTIARQAEATRAGAEGSGPQTRWHSGRRGPGCR